MFSTVIAVAAVAGSLVHAAPAPIAPRGAPKTWAWGYLEDYDVYHLRYLALDCQDKHDTSFFEDCCHPLLADESLSSRPSYCTPNTTEIASASAYISSTSVYGPPKTSAVSGTATATIDWEADGYPSAAVASSTPASSAAATTTTAAQVAAAPPVESSSTTSSSTTTYQAPTTTQAPSTTQAPTTTQAPQTTSQASNNNGGNNGGSLQSGGYATYFYQGGNPGACGNYNSDSAHIVAIDSAWWPNFGVQSQYCGRSLTIKNNNNGKTVTATVADVCPTCVNGNSLDLSVGAFTAIASESDGMVPITWWWN